MNKYEIDKYLSVQHEEAEKYAAYWNDKLARLREAIYGLSHPHSMEAASQREWLHFLARSTLVDGHIVPANSDLAKSINKAFGETVVSVDENNQFKVEK